MLHETLVIAAVLFHHQRQSCADVEEAFVKLDTFMPVEFPHFCRFLLYIGKVIVNPPGKPEPEVTPIFAKLADASAGPINEEPLKY